MGWDWFYIGNRIYTKPNPTKFSVNTGPNTCLTQPHRDSAVEAREPLNDALDLLAGGPGVPHVARRVEGQVNLNVHDISASHRQKSKSANDRDKTQAKRTPKRTTKKKVGKLKRENENNKPRPQKNEK